MSTSQTERPPFDEGLERFVMTEWVVVRRKHTPGGQDHDQSSHGSWASGRAAVDRDERDAPVIASFEQEFRSARVEHGIVISEDGTVESISSGREEAISLTDSQIANLRGGVLAHNHPIKGAPLSWADVAVAVRADAREVRSVSKDGWVSSLKAPKGSWANAPGGIEGAYGEAVSPSIVFGAIRAGSQRELNQLLNDYLAGVAEKTGGTYTFERLYTRSAPKPKAEERPAIVIDLSRGFRPGIEVED